MLWRSLLNDDVKYKSFILCLNMKTIRAKQAEVYFAHFVQRDQQRITAKPLS